ncbi:MAG: hypothetical protein MRY21_07980 [Simkaniaceae bacterium]|nr:hypothetical protein [Simkaniaceae bacterium]
MRLFLLIPCLIFAYDASFSNIFPEVLSRCHGAKWCQELQIPPDTPFDQLDLDADYLDYLALEYCRAHEDAYIATIWPRNCLTHEVQIREILEKYCTLVYCKSFTLTVEGSKRYLFSIPEKRAFKHHYHHYFPRGLKSYPLMCYVVRARSLEDVVAAKKHVRRALGYGKKPYCLHFNDTHEQCLDLAHMVLNNNSLHFINYHEKRPFRKFESHFPKYKAFLEGREGEDYCVDGSCVLSAYGIRDTAVDFDFISSKYVKRSRIFPLDHHNKAWERLGLSIDEIIYNPKNFFYNERVKFTSLPALREMKMKQNRLNDQRDVESINSMIGLPQTDTQ